MAFYVLGAMPTLVVGMFSRDLHAHASVSMAPVTVHGSVVVEAASRRFLGRHIGFDATNQRGETPRLRGL